MGVEDKISVSDIAYGDISTAGALTGARNMTAVRNGAGDYSVTIGEATDELECQVTVCGKTAALSWTVVHTSDTVKQILFLDTATGLTPTDSEFSILVSRIFIA